MRSPWDSNALHYFFDLHNSYPPFMFLIYFLRNILYNVLYNASSIPFPCQSASSTPSMASFSRISFHIPLNLPLHLDPFPPPLTPSLAFKPSPTDFTPKSSDPNTNTVETELVVCVDGEEDNTTT